MSNLVDRTSEREKLSFVIPCYRSEKSLPIVVEGILTTMANQERYDFEIILVNDGSGDATFSAITKLAGRDSRIKGLNLAKNFGQHAALMAGYSVVSGDYVVGLDDDGEHDPADVFKLIDKIHEGYDYVCAKHTTVNHSLFQKIGSRINSQMATSLIGKPKNITFTSYYIMRRFLVNEIIKYPNPYPYVGGLILSVTKNLGEVEIQHKKRLFGRSTYSLGKMLSLWVNGFTAFSLKPLRIATVVGTITSFLGFGYGAIVIVNKLFFNQASLMGYSSIMATLLFIGGMIMLMLGLIGEYIGRIYISINKVPQYTIRDRVNDGM